MIVEAGSKQAYVFATNKRREALGASELIRLVGKDWLEDLAKKPGVTPVIRSSGLAMFLTDTEALGQGIVRQVTMKALREASGLDVYGYVSPAQEIETPDQLREAQRQAFIHLAEVRARRPGAGLRHLRLPIVAECSTSALPAAGRAKQGSEKELRRSQASLDKLKKARDAYQRLASSLDIEESKVKKAADHFEKSEETIGVIHADGNGIGKIFAEFKADGTGPNGPSLQGHLDQLRRFSEAVEECSLEALKTASEQAGHVLPLVVGGDDVTILCDGKSSIKVASVYLEAFERLTKEHPDIAAQTKKVIGRPGLSAAAGIAIVKPHFPFSTGYELAEQLCGSAKTFLKSEEVAKSLPGASALDFHVVRDSISPDLETHRSADGKYRIACRPLLVGDAPTDEVSPSVVSLETIRSVVQEISDPEGLSRSTWYQIRLACADSGEIADELYRLRKLERGLELDSLLGESLFVHQVSKLGDALDLMDIEAKLNEDLAETHERAS